MVRNVFLDEEVIPAKAQFNIPQPKSVSFAQGGQADRFSSHLKELRIHLKSKDCPVPPQA